MELVKNIFFNTDKLVENSKIKISKCERGRNMSKKISVILIGIIIFSAAQVFIHLRK